MINKRKVLECFAAYINLIYKALDYFGYKRKPQLRVLLFHDIAPDHEDSFKCLIEWLMLSWEFITPGDFSELILKKRPLLRDSLLVTFDDGYYSNRLVAESILNPKNIKAIYFVLPELVNIESTVNAKEFISNNLWPDGGIEGDYSHWSNMKIEDLLFLIETGHHIGAHTMTHARLSGLNEEELINEIVDSANLLEKMLKIKIRDFAYSFGDLESFSESAFKVASSRFDFIFTGLGGNNAALSNSLGIARDSINPNDPKSFISTLLFGSADWYFYLKLRKFIQWRSNLKSH